MSPIENAQSVGHAVQLACQHWGNKTSRLLPVKGEYIPVSHNELWARISQFAAALEELGVQPGARLNIFAENSFSWALMDLAAKTLGAITVPIYPTLPGDQAQYIIENCGAKWVFCGNAELQQRCGESTGARTMLVADLAELAEKRVAPQDFDAKILRTQREDIATIIYTSGTTGNPKGVMLTHANFLHMAKNVRETLPMDENDVFFSFLPMSHVYEHADGHLLPTLLGATVGYAQNLASIASDVQKVRPTIMLCVPRFLEAMRSKIMDTMEKAPPVRRRLFHLALDQGTARFQGKPAPLFPLTNRLVGEKIRARMGGRLKFFVSGGAALPSKVAEFFGAFDLLVLQGYGLTETTSGMCFNTPENNDYRTLGIPLQGSEMKIAPDGEILIRGGFVMKGYYNMPEATSEAIDAEGWFHTGDVGEVLPSGHYRLTDRKKDLLILANGKNVAPQVIENVLKESPYIAEVVLFGDGMEYVCGLIIPDFERVKGWVLGQGIQPGTPEAMLQFEPVRALLKSEIDKVNKTLADFEKVKRHVLLAAQFTVEDGSLTPSLKVKRRVVKERFAAEIASMMR